MHILAVVNENSERPISAYRRVEVGNSTNILAFAKTWFEKNYVKTPEKTLGDIANALLKGKTYWVDDYCFQLLTPYEEI